MVTPFGSLCGRGIIESFFARIALTRLTVVARVRFEFLGGRFGAIKLLLLLLLSFSAPAGIEIKVVRPAAGREVPPLFDVM